MTASGLAQVLWTDASQITRGEATVYCAALAEATGRRPGYWPSRTYVCPQCGQAWMREEWKHKFQYASMAGPSWVVVQAPCRWHGGGFLLDNIPLEAVSEDLLRRECNLYWRYYDTSIGRQSPIFSRHGGLWGWPNASRAESASPGPNRNGEDNGLGHSSGLGG